MDKAAYEIFCEAMGKVMTMDSSHDAIRSGVGDALRKQHQIDNAGTDNYYDYPYVQDTFGDNETGTVVHSKKGQLTMSKYKKGKDGSYAVSDSKSVKRAYVADTANKKESFVVTLDGKDLVVTEAADTAVLEEFVVLNESTIITMEEAAGVKNGRVKLTLISEGVGSSGEYTDASLKKAVKDGIFNGAPMFLNHQTEAERKARPEGDVTKKTGKIIPDTVQYVPRSGTEPSKIVGEALVYSDFVPFVSARKEDLGVSVSVGVHRSGKIGASGKPLVESMAFANSTDWVTAAGRGGKIEEMYESFRGTREQQREEPAGSEVMTPEEKAKYDQLQESATKLTADNAKLAADSAKLAARLDRMEESNNKATAITMVHEAFKSTGLSERAINRATTLLMATLPMKDGAFDTVAFKESITKEVNEEVSLAQESGHRVSPHLIRRVGATGAEETKPVETAVVLEESRKRADASIAAITGEKKSA